MLREQVGVIVLMVLIAGGAAFGLSLIQSPTYEAEASVSFHDDTQDLALLGIVVTPGVAPLTLATASAATLERDEVVSGVKRRLNTKASLKTLRDLVFAIPDFTSNLVKITAKSSDPRVAAVIADAFAAEGRDHANADARRRYAVAIRDLRRRVGARGKGGTAAERRIYQSQLARLRTVGTFVRAATIAQQARVPEHPKTPRRVRNTIFGLLTGLAIGIVAAFLRDTLDRRLRTAADVQDALHLPPLGFVRNETLGRSLVATGRRKTTPVDVEAFRIMRRNLEYLDIDGGLTTVVVTSALPEEGKSTVAASLALAAAASGKRALLLECDLRQPSLAARLGARATPGLSDHLAGDASPADVLQVVRFAGQQAKGAGSAPEFAVVTAGSATSHPAQLLGSQRFENLLGEVREAYDLVVVDSSPLLPVVDTLEIVPHVDGVILCVRAGRTTRDQAAAARSILDHLPSRPTGLVVTGTRARDESTSGAYGYAYANYRHDLAGVA